MPVIRVYSEKPCNKRYADVAPFTFVYGDEEDQGPFDYAVILGQFIPDNLTLDKARVIGFSTQANPSLTLEFIAWAQEHVGRYYLDTIDPLDPPFVTAPSFLPFFLPSQPIIEKGEIMSLVIRSNRSCPGYAYSMQIANLILKNDLPVHIYGHDGLLLCSRENQIPWQLQGTFSEPLKPYLDYAFTIVVEDYPSPHFFSSAIQEAVLCRCVPLYLGAENADRHFPRALISLTGKLANDLRVIGEVLKNPETFYKEEVDPLFIPWFRLFKMEDSAKRDLKLDSGALA